MTQEALVPELLKNCWESSYILSYMAFDYDQLGTTFAIVEFSNLGMYEPLGTHCYWMLRARDK